MDTIKQNVAPPRRLVKQYKFRTGVCAGIGISVGSDVGTGPLDGYGSRGEYRFQSLVSLDFGTVFPRFCYTPGEHRIFVTKSKCHKIELPLIYMLFDLYI